MDTSKKIKLLVPILVGVVLIAGVALSFLIYGDRSSKNNANNSGAGDQTSQTTSSDSHMSGSMSDSMKSDDSAAAAAVETTNVQIDDYKFSPAAIKVKVGQTVTWTNNDNVRHNVVADTTSNDAPNGPLIARGESYTFTFSKAGTYTYHCDPHPYMKASVIVTE